MNDILTWTNEEGQEMQRSLHHLSVDELLEKLRLHGNESDKLEALTIRNAAEFAVASMLIRKSEKRNSYEE